MTVDMIWTKIPVSIGELNLSTVLRCGQAFRWKNVNNVWSLGLKDRVVFVKQDETNLYYSSLLKKGHQGNQTVLEETEQFFVDYFNLKIDLIDLYKYWSRQHDNFKSAGRKRKASEIAESTENGVKIEVREVGMTGMIPNEMNIEVKEITKSPFSKFKGIRILRQDPWETTVSFICSSNNNVKRISKMCESLCTEFGEYINTYEGVDYYSFPSAETLAKSPAVESKLRLLGFGYRAKYIYQSAVKLTLGGLSVLELEGLREKLYEEAHEYLIQLSGVGPKVADCICLMALDKHDIVPVDTHVYQIAMRDYKFKGKRDLKSLNKETYSKIRSHFKDIFGPYAGWAQSVLFAADLLDLNNGVNVVEISQPKLELNTKIAGNVTGTKRMKNK